MWNAIHSSLHDFSLFPMLTRRRHEGLHRWLSLNLQQSTASTTVIVRLGKEKGTLGRYAWPYCGMFRADKIPTLHRVRHVLSRRWRSPYRKTPTKIERVRVFTNTPRTHSAMEVLVVICIICAARDEECELNLCSRESRIHFIRGSFRGL